MLRKPANVLVPQPLGAGYQRGGRGAPSAPAGAAGGARSPSEGVTSASCVFRDVQGQALGSPLAHWDSTQKTMVSITSCCICPSSPKTTGGCAWPGFGGLQRFLGFLARASDLIASPPVKRSRDKDSGSCASVQFAGDEAARVKQLYAANTQMR